MPLLLSGSLQPDEKVTCEACFISCHKGITPAATLNKMLDYSDLTFFIR